MQEERSKNIHEIVVAYVLGYIEDEKFSPTMQEIADHIKDKTGIVISRSGVKHYVDGLVRLGRLRRKKHGHWRNILPPVDERTA